ncbi:MAG: hypothetical protein QXE06_08885 [Candidatus Bathyarchaeia archaeon]
MSSVKTLFEPETVILVGSSRVEEDAGLALPLGCRYGKIIGRR